MQLFLGILLLVMSIFLVAAVLMQSGKSKRLSGSIAGGAETFFGKAKSRTIDAVLSKLTTVVAILFVIVVIVVYVAFGTEPVEVNPDGTITLTPEQLNQMIENGEINISTGEEGETEAPVEGEADTPAEGEADTPAEGETEAPVEGEAEAPVEGETEAPVEE